MSFNQQIKEIGEQNLSSDDIIGAFSGAPDGSKFLADDGTLKTPSGSGGLPDAGTTGGTSTAYTATLAGRPNPLTNGYSFVCIFNVTNGASPTIALSSGTAQPLKIDGVAAWASALIPGSPHFCRSDGTSVHLLGPYKKRLLEYSRITSDQSGAALATRNTAVFNSADKNEGSCWTESSGIFTCTRAGRYMVWAQIYISTAGSDKGVSIIKNGSTTIAGNYTQTGGGVGLIWAVSKFIDLAVGDTVLIQFYSASPPTMGAVSSLIQILEA